MYLKPFAALALALSLPLMQVKASTVKSSWGIEPDPRVEENLRHLREKYHGGLTKKYLSSQAAEQASQSAPFGGNIPKRKRTQTGKKSLVEESDSQQQKHA